MFENKNVVVVSFSIFFAFILCLGICFKVIKYNDVQDFQVIQSPSGAVELKTDGGYYYAFFPRVWTYSKINTVFFSNDRQESRDNDGVNVVFSNKGTGNISSQVVFRLHTDNDRMLKLHQYARGDVDIIENLVLAKIKDIAMTEASKITSSQAIENRESFAQSIRAKILSHKELLDMGIVVEQFNITSIDFDDKTKQLFSQQQESDLLKKTAEAKKQQLEMEKERVEAEYAKQVAESQGRAEVEKIKAVTDAQRQKELAEIEAQKKVEVEKLAKEEAIVKAGKLLEVVEIERQTEAKRLEVIRIQAEQKVAEALAKQKQIELSGAITEQEQFRLTVEKETKIGIANALAKGVGQWILPKTVIIGGGSSESNGTSSLENLLKLLTVQKAEEISNETSKK